MSQEFGKSLASERHLGQPEVGASAADADEKILLNPYITGKYIPSDPTGIYHLVLRSGDAGPFPVPPKDLWEGYGQDDKTYLESGRRHTSAMLEILQRAGSTAESLSRVLDLGCAAGRMVRFFPHHDRAEIWGVDINAKHIAWCQAHLSPPLLFATVTTLPHLPFEDGYFDLIYCGSVFTHISNDLADTWLLELRRVLREGGLLYITVQDEASVHTLLANAGPTNASSLSTADLSWEKPDGEPGTSSAGMYWISEFNKTIEFSKLDYTCFSFSWDGCLNVFYDRKYLVNKWSRFLELVSVTPDAYGCQTALLWRKAASGRLSSEIP